jgi:hypothetical protein
MTTDATAAGTAKGAGADTPLLGFSTSSKYVPAQFIGIVAVICVELLRTVDNALRKPKLSQGGFTHATASGEKFAPVMTTDWLKAAGALEFQLTFPASTDVITGAESVTVTKAVNVVDEAAEGTVRDAGADNPPPGCGFSTSSE